MEKTSFYRCKSCNTIVHAMGGPTPCCCEEKREVLQPNTVDAATEKHIPVASFRGGRLHVQVGSTVHPMTAEHQILWIYVETRTGGMFHRLTPQDAPEAVFTVAQEDVCRIYEYCNLHGLWMADVSHYVFDETVCSPEFPQSCINKAEE